MPRAKSVRLRNPTAPFARCTSVPGERVFCFGVIHLYASQSPPKTTSASPKRNPEPGAREVAATATRKGNHWIVDLPEIHQGTQTENLRNANRIAHALAVEKLGVAPDEVTVKLSITMPADTAEKWEQAKAQQREAREAATRAAQLSRQAVHELKAQGCNYQDIRASPAVSTP